MSSEEVAESWVVYQMPTRGKPTRKSPVFLTAVCEQSEWDEMELGKPGYYTLVKAGILNEGEAERLARYGPTGSPAPLPFPKLLRG